MFDIGDYLQRTQNMLQDKLNPSFEHILILDFYQCQYNNNEWRYKIKVIRKEEELDSNIDFNTAHKYFTKIY